MGAEDLVQRYEKNVKYANFMRLGGEKEVNLEGRDDRCPADGGRKNTPEENAPEGEMRRCLSKHTERRYYLFEACLRGY